MPASLGNQVANLVVQDQSWGFRMAFIPSHHKWLTWGGANIAESTEIFSTLMRTLQANFGHSE